MMVKKRILGIIFCIVIVFILHITPSLSIRTKLFFSYHPITAFTTEISAIGEVYEEYCQEHNAVVYTISKPVTSTYGTGDVEQDEFIVYRHGIYNSAKYIQDKIVEIMDV